MTQVNISLSEIKKIQYRQNQSSKMDDQLKDFEKQIRSVLASHMAFSAHKHIIDVDINANSKQAAKDEFIRVLDTMFPEYFEKALIGIKGVVTIKTERVN